jgi:hypothetical protein
MSVLGLLPVLLVLGACGGSKHTTSTQQPTVTAPASIPSSTQPSIATSTATSHTTVSTARTTTTTTSAAGSSTGGQVKASGARNKPAGGSTHVRVPATFVIGTGGRLSPPSVSAPAFLAVQLTVSSGDGRSHHLLLRAPGPVRLTVPAHGRASVLIGGLRAGRYEISVDGASGGALIIGGEPGP